MAKLNLRSDYLENEPKLVVTGYEDVNMVSVKYAATYCEPPLPISTDHLCKIVSGILEDNSCFKLQSMYPAPDGTILFFVQVVPEMVAGNLNHSIKSQTHSHCEFYMWKMLGFFLIKNLDSKIIAIYDGWDGLNIVKLWYFHPINIYDK